LYVSIKAFAMIFTSCGSLADKTSVHKVLIAWKPFMSGTFFCMISSSSHGLSMLNSRINQLAGKLSPAGLTAHDFDIDSWCIYV
jgi:hypothetical protein